MSFNSLLHRGAEVVSKATLVLSILTGEAACIQQQQREVKTQVGTALRVGTVLRSASLSPEDDHHLNFPSSAIYENFKTGIPEVRPDATLFDKVLYSQMVGQRYLEMLASNPDFYIEERKISSGSLSESRSRPFSVLSKQEKYAIAVWLGVSSHLVQAGIPNEQKIVNAALDYLVANIDDPEMIDVVQAHIMALEAELGESNPNDPRLKKIIDARYSRGLSKKSGGDSQVTHTLRSGEKLPVTEELSWVMLTAVHGNAPYAQKAFKLLDDQNKEHLLAPSDLADIAFGYMESLENDFLKKKTDYSPGTSIFDYIENGCHAVQGAIAILGKYGPEMKKNDPQIYQKLVEKIPSVIHLLMDYDFHGNEYAVSGFHYDYMKGGHLLQAILDKDAAAVFTVDGKKVTARDAIKSHKIDIFSSQEPQDPDLKLLQRIIHAAAGDNKQEIFGLNSDPTGAIYTVGHATAGLTELRNILTSE